MLGPLVKKKRGDRKLRETSQNIGIGPATLMRIENGRSPDIETFSKICRWLNIEPGQFLGFEKKVSPDSNQLNVAAHFRAERALKPETANALAQMILCVSRMQENP